MTAERSCCQAPTGSWPTPRRAEFEHAGGGGLRSKGAWWGRTLAPGCHWRVGRDPPNFSLAKYLRPEQMNSSLLPPEMITVT